MFVHTVQGVDGIQDQSSCLGNIGVCARDLGTGKPAAGLLPLLYTPAHWCDMSWQCRDWIADTQLGAPLLPFGFPGHLQPGRMR